MNACRQNVMVNNVASTLPQSVTRTQVHHNCFSLRSRLGIPVITPLVHLKLLCFETAALHQVNLWFASHGHLRTVMASAVMKQAGKARMLGRGLEAR